ncbi:MAG TPA: glycosyltransferase family 4 protein [Gemmatimonadales bacterium]|nr:glycosyltransferase family 4 protein [Gemmatimonadales bacterium]
MTLPQLLLSYDFPPMGGGIARWMGELAKHFPPGSLVVSTGELPGSETADRQFPNGIDRLPLPSARLRTLPGMVLWSRRAAALTRSTGCEFVWCGNLKPAAYPARWTRRQTGVPYGIMLHGGDLLILQGQIQRSRLKREVARVLLGSASLLVTNSRYTASLCRSILEQLQLSEQEWRIHTVPLGADPLRFRPGQDLSEVRARYNLDSRRWLLSVARLTPHKGIDAAIRAVAELRTKYPDIGYLVVGSGEQLASLKELSSRLNVEDRIYFLTGVPDEDLPALYNCAAVYVGLSRVMEERVEGFGISLVEASASALPVIATRTGGIPDAVRHEDTGLLIAPDEPEELMTALCRVLDDKDLAARLGARGRHAVETYFNWSRVADDLARLGREAGASR